MTSRSSSKAARALYAKADVEVNTSDKNEAQAFAALLARHRAAAGRLNRGVLRLQCLCAAAVTGSSAPG